MIKILEYSRIILVAIRLKADLGIVRLQANTVIRIGVRFGGLDWLPPSVLDRCSTKSRDATLHQKAKMGRQIVMMTALVIVSYIWQF